MIGKDISLAVELLKKGEIVALPTETVYGLAANALNPTAVAKIFEAKQRPFFDPLIVHVKDAQECKKYTSHFPEKAKTLAQQFWPGALTLVLPKNNTIPDIVTAGNPTVGIRVPKHPLTVEVLQQLEFPLAAPSANPFGYVSPTTAQHVEDQLGNAIPYIVDGGACEVGIESTIVTFEEEEAVVLRLGGTSIDDIERVIGKVVLRIHQNSNPLAPGQIDSHYAPTTKFIVGEIPNTLPKGEEVKEIGAITLSEKIEWLPAENQIQLSKNYDLKEAASNIFAAMRILDKRGLSKIWAAPLPNEGLGKAINDRLKRAAYKGKRTI